MIPKPRPKRITRKQKVHQLDEVDHVPTNTRSSHNESQKYLFEDKEAVIKMIIKGRSPTMRHVSRTHRVALDWLFDRITLEPKIQIKYVDTKNQLAYILTKGSFSRNEWNHLLCLFNIMNFSTFSGNHLTSFLSEDGEQIVFGVMSKRSEDKTRLRVTGKTHQSGNARSVQRGHLTTKFKISCQSGE